MFQTQSFSTTLRISVFQNKQKGLPKAGPMEGQIQHRLRVAQYRVDLEEKIWQRYLRDLAKGDQSKWTNQFIQDQVTILREKGKPSRGKQ